MMDEWKASGKGIAKLTLKIYSWNGSVELDSKKKEEQAELIGDTLNQLCFHQKAILKKDSLSSQSTGPSGEAESVPDEEDVVTSVPFYDIKFEVICNSSIYDFETVQHYIVVFENVFGFSLPKCSITEFKNHSFHDITKTFSYAFNRDQRRKSSLDKYMALTMRKSNENNEEEKWEETGSAENKATKNEEYKPKVTINPKDFSKFLAGKSEIFDELFVGLIQPYLPGYLRRTQWKLLYSTGKHGISLQT
jgi:hypothetical protein